MVAALFAGAGIAHAAFSPDAWKYMRTVTIPAGSGQSSFAKVVLPSDISRTAEGFADIRILNQDGIETPYLLTRSISQKGDVMTPRLLDMGTVGGETRFVADVGQNGLVHSGMSIDAASKNFKRQVKVYASHWPIAVDSSEWALITDKGYIFKFTDPQTGYVAGKNEVSFPASSARYLKVVISSGEEGPVAVSNAVLYGDSHVDVPTTVKEFPVSVFNNPTKRATEITVDLGGPGNLTNAISLNTEDRNYSRRVIIESSNSNGATSTWRYVGQGSISNVSTSMFAGSSNRIAYSEQKSRFIRASIVNDDNRPLAVGAAASIESPVISAVFETRPGEAYRLYYGNPLAVVPVYDIARMASYLEENKIPSAFLSDETDNAAYVIPQGPVVPFTESHQWLLNALLVIVVLIIGGGVAWYLRTYMNNSQSNAK
ncbi:MAG: hypothetical protein JWO73_695 [Candidatus Taylorbacteria bacterium]|nr:hypothetical protein [Candidatus Taylorbacteria bacterium]